ncbi:hypothetical protein [Bradyrhizobium sp. AZCC 2289]|uniref:hypothetical protein n=1 Tax=Bradyrhizobium sp. AZCC 2289 TaxID=3117026 RepID=UPI002FF1E665
MNDDYFKQQADRIRAMADKADPFTKKRLLDLAERYDAKLGRPSRATRQLRPPLVPEHSSQANAPTGAAEQLPDTPSPR